MNNARTCRAGFSLLEIVVGLIIISIGIVAASGLLIAAKIWISRSEMKSGAIKLAYSLMESYMAQSYEGLGEKAGNGGTITHPPGALLEETGTRDSYSWTAVVREDTVDGAFSVPFKDIEVRVAYEEKNEAGGLSEREIRLKNIMPYPMAHTEYRFFDPDRNPAPTDPVKDEGMNPRTPIPKLLIPFNYATPMDVLVIYNLSLNVDNPEAVPENNNVYTSCNMDGVNQGLITGTPITSQPLISNTFLFENIRPLPGTQQHTLQITWSRDTGGGSVSLLDANLIIIAFEHGLFSGLNVR